MFGCLGLLTLSYHLGNQVTKVTQLPSLTLILMDVTLLDPLLNVPQQLSGPFKALVTMLLMEHPISLHQAVLLAQ